MPRHFAIPEFYRSPIVSRLKQIRLAHDGGKRDLLPSVLDLGRVHFKIARHFGFCFGVENAIEIAYRAISENPDKRVFLLSEMIHNPHVNQDLAARGVTFLMTADGQTLIPFEQITKDDVVIVPAFGTTSEIFSEMRERGLDVMRYNATCPFVEKVWRRSEELGNRGFTIVIHGKHQHEETKATFSHASTASPSVVVRDRVEALKLAEYILDERNPLSFEVEFAGRYSQGFSAEQHLQRIGVVNQTTMLAGKTGEIANILREALLKRYGPAVINQHFADTRDTLCYATSENQRAVSTLVDSGGDLAIVIGGYNSSNTSHLVQLLEERVPTYFIRDADEILSRSVIRHLDRGTKKVVESSDWLPNKNAALQMLIAAGASCPDLLVEHVLNRIAGFFDAQEYFPQALLQLDDRLKKG